MYIESCGVLIGVEHEGRSIFLEPHPIRTRGYEKFRAAGNEARSQKGRVHVWTATVICSRIHDHLSAHGPGLSFVAPSKQHCARTNDVHLAPPFSLIQRRSFDSRLHPSNRAFINVPARGTNDSWKLLTQRSITLNLLSPGVRAFDSMFHNAWCPLWQLILGGKITKCKGSASRLINGA